MRKLGRTTKFKKPDITTKVGKYFMAVRKGKSKKEAQIIAGYPKPTNAYNIEKTRGFQELQSYFKNELLQKISVGEIADALVDNIKQIDADHIDRGSRNRAIEIALERIEPSETPIDDDEKVLIVLQK